jgi:spermidine/putrescine-binding protein
MSRDNTTRRNVLAGTGAAGAAALAGCLGGVGGGGGGGDDFSGQTLNVLTWAGYEGVAKMVEEQTGATVNLKLISSDVDGFNTLQGGGTSQFDVLVLDNTWAQRNAQADNIVSVSEADYPAVEDVIGQFAWPYDTFQHEGEQWAVPPRWGWGGLGYDDREVDLATLEEKGYTAVWDGSFEGEVTTADWPTWVIPLVVLQLFDLGGENPMAVELSDSQLQELEDTLVKVFDNAVAVHTGAAAMRQDMLQGNAKMVFGTGNFGLSQLPAQGHDWMKIMVPPDVGGWYWVEGLCLVNNSNLKRDLANEFINTCLTDEGQYSICWEDAESKGAPVITSAFDQFSEEEQKKIMMWEDKGFEAADTLLSDLHQYLISPQQDQWLDIWERAKAKADI